MRWLPRILSLLSSFVRLASLPTTVAAPLVLVAGLAAQAAGVDTLLAQGDALYEKERYRQAFAIYDKAVKLAPRNAQALANRGITAFNLRRYKLAKQDLETSLKLDKDCDFCRNPIAWIHFYYGDYEGARRWLKTAHRHQDKDQSDKALLKVIESPFKRRFKAQADKLTGRTPSGRYRLTTDLGATPGKPIAGDHTKEWHAAAKILDWAYANAYAPAFPFPKDDGLVLNVVLFAREKDYGGFEKLVGMEKGSTYGVYVPELKTLLLHDDPESAKGQMLAGLHRATTDTLLHEGLHQFLDYYVDDVPTWYSEGMGEYYGSASMIDGRLAVGVPNRYRLPEIREILASRKGPVPLKDFLLMDYDRFMKEEQSMAHYAQAWAIIHYLHASPSGRKLLADYLAVLMQGQDAKGAFDAVFAKQDLRALDRGWRDHVKKMKLGA